MTVAKPARKPATKAARMCIVDVGYQKFALPVSKGLAVIDLLREAEPVEWAIGDCWQIESQPLRLELQLVSPAQVLPAVPDGAPTLH
ncbi:hypothetical protein [Pseudomonas sp. PS02288]|uniref:hypothetical protein n=1 Tax=Pseudomonas sp. PS02288 TaxID=2991443 RepID=UPI00249BB91C|nr:hypothetical protein [Pseudomonas sp. PS02288]